MSAERSGSGSDPGSTATDDGGTNGEEAEQVGASTSSVDLQGQIELLEAENRRLRREYVRARQTKYRRTAVGLVIVGVLAIGGGVLFPVSQQVLFALGGSAVVAGILTYYLTPETFVAASLSETLVATVQESYERIRAELDLVGDPVYVPLSDGPLSDARLFLPQHHEHTIPAEDSLRETFVVTEEPDRRGVSLSPTGSGLLEEFQNATDLTALSDDEPEQIFEVLADGLVEQFELAERVSSTVEGDRRCVIAVSESAFGELEGLDHPITSFLGVGAAVTLGQPTRVEVRNTDAHDYVLECRWDVESDA